MKKKKTAKFIGDECNNLKDQFYVAAHCETSTMLSKALLLFSS